VTFCTKFALIQQVVFAEREGIRSRGLRLWTNGLLWYAGALLPLEPAIDCWRWRRRGQVLLSTVVMALLTLACPKVFSTLVLLLAVALLM